MTMSQSGNKVSGSYKVSSEVITIVGTVSGNTLGGTWNLGASSDCTFSYTLTGSGQQFTGTITFPGGTTGPFCGARSGSALPSCP